MFQLDDRNAKSTFNELQSIIVLTQPEAKKTFHEKNIKNNGMLSNDYECITDYKPILVFSSKWHTVYSWLLDKYHTLFEFCLWLKAIVKYYGICPDYMGHYQYTWLRFEWTFYINIADDFLAIK